MFFWNEFLCVSWSWTISVNWQFSGNRQIWNTVFWIQLIQKLSIWRMFRQRRFASLLTKSVTDRVMTVELNHRPVNLLTRPLLNEFAETFKSVEVGGDVGAIVLTSGTFREIDTFRFIGKSSKNDQKNVILTRVKMTSGTPGVFTAGLDIMEIYQRTDESIIDYWSQLQEMWISLYSCPIPVICAINGIFDFDALFPV